MAGLRGDPLKPVLQVAPLVEDSSVEGGFRPPKGLLLRFLLRLLPALPADALPLRRLLPTRGCFRKLQMPQQQQQGQGDGDRVPTPLYNQRILEDVFFRQHFHELHTAVT